MKVYSPHNFDPNDDVFITYNTGVSNVEPNQALTPVELVRRYASGNLQGINVNDFYFDIPLNSPIIPSCDPSFNEVRAMRSYVNAETRAARRASEQEQKRKMEDAARVQSDEGAIKE